MAAILLAEVGWKVHVSEGKGKFSDTNLLGLNILDWIVSVIDLLFSKILTSDEEKLITETAKLLSV